MNVVLERSDAGRMQDEVFYSAPWLRPTHQPDGNPSNGLTALFISRRRWTRLHLCFFHCSQLEGCQPTLGFRVLLPHQQTLHQGRQSDHHLSFPPERLLTFGFLINTCRGSPATPNGVQHHERSNDQGDKETPVRTSINRQSNLSISAE